MDQTNNKSFGFYRDINNCVIEFLKAGNWERFRRDNFSAYNSVRHFHSLDQLEELTGIKRRRIKPANYWTEETIRPEAKTFKSRHEFRTKAPGAAQAADRLGIFESVCDHMPIGEEGSSYGIYAIISNTTKMAYVGLASDFDERKNAHFKHQNPDCLSRQVTVHLDAEFVILIPCSLTASDASKAEIEAYNDYLNQGFNVVNNKKNLGMIGSRNTKHTKNSFKKLVDEFKGTYEEFIAPPEMRSCLQKARSRGWINYAIEKLPSSKLTFEQALNLAAQFETISEFENGHSNVVDQARYHGWMEKITQHMKRPAKRNPKSKWGTEEKIWMEVRLRDSLKDFINNSNGAYKSMLQKFPWLKQEINKFYADRERTASRT